MRLSHMRTTDARRPTPLQRTCILHYWPTQVRLRKKPVDPWQMTSRLSPTVMKLLLVFQFVAHFPRVGGINLAICGIRLEVEQGTPLHISYEQCLAECGTGIGDIDWVALSGSLGTWLLPWITLMFQIPFSAERKFYRSFLFHYGEQTISPHRFVG